MTPFVFRVLHVSTWIHFGADRTPPFDISEKGVIRFCVSSNAFAVHCHFDVKYYLHSTTYFPLPPSHTTYSVDEVVARQDHGFVQREGVAVKQEYRIKGSRSLSQRRRGV